jgi:hypothetical protein
MRLLILLLLFSSTSLAHSPNYFVPRCELVEVNHFCEPNGNPIFTQLIFWDWCSEYSRWNAQGFTMITEWEVLPQVLVITTKDKKEIHVGFKYFRETKTYYDPERFNLKLFPEKYRRKVW